MAEQRKRGQKKSETTSLDQAKELEEMIMSEENPLKLSFLNFQKDFFDNIYATTVKKNHDYAGQGNPFANFLKAEQLGVTSAEKGILVRMLDKFSRINNFIEQGVLLVEDESIIDTLKDLSNYSALLANLIHHRKLGKLVEPSKETSHA